MDSKNPFFSRHTLHPKKPPPQQDPAMACNQIGGITDVNIGQLREQIKNAMIPLLIKVFELKLAAQQAKTPPSRLQKQPKESIEKITEQLNLLLKDLDLLHLWCESSQKQVLKAIKEMETMSETPAKEERETLSDEVYAEAASTLKVKERERSSWLRKFFPW